MTTKVRVWAYCDGKARVFHFNMNTMLKAIIEEQGFRDIDGITFSLYKKINKVLYEE